MLEDVSPLIHEASSVLKFTGGESQVFNLYGVVIKVSSCGYICTFFILIEILLIEDFGSAFHTGCDLICSGVYMH